MFEKSPRTSSDANFHHFGVVKPIRAASSQCAGRVLLSNSQERRRGNRPSPGRAPDFAFLLQCLQGVTNRCAANVEFASQLALRRKLAPRFKGAICDQLFNVPPDSIVKLCLDHWMKSEK